jgi:hypothetical protein
LLLRELYSVWQEIGYCSGYQFGNPLVLDCIQPLS